jgi:hypothetical protein
VREKFAATMLAAISVTGCADRPQSPIPTVSVNEEVNVGQFAFTVTGVDIGERKVGYETAQGIFVLVRIAVRNIGAEPRTVYCQDQKLRALSGKTYDDGMTVGDRQELVNIKPGKQVRFTCAFDVPTGTLPAAVEVRDSQYSRGAIVQVLSKG